MIPLPLYSQVKDKYCIAYFGNANEYLWELKLLRHFIEKELVGLQVYIAHKGISFLEDEPRCLTQSDLKSRKFGYVRELACNMKSHPVEDLLSESSIPYDFVQVPENNKKGFMICSEGILPTKSLSSEQISYLRKMAIQKGYIECHNLNDAGWMLGVENETLLEGASLGSKVSLIPTGFGENLMRRMFQNIDILN